MAATETIDVVMPQMGVSVSEGTITKWLKREGEEIGADETLLEISTDKVDTEVPSPGAGVVLQILVQEGETVDVGTRLAVIGPAGASAPAAPAPVPEPATQRAADEANAAASEGVGAVAPSSQEEAEEDGQPSNGKTFVSPVVARIASEHGVDVARVPGTGRGGRVTKKDIMAFIESGAQAPAKPQTPEPAPVTAPAEATVGPPPPPKPAPLTADAGEPGPGETFEPMTAMRRGVADHMRRSVDTSAHVTSAIEV